MGEDFKNFSEISRFLARYQEFYEEIDGFIPIVKSDSLIS